MADKVQYSTYQQNGQTVFVWKDSDGKIHRSSNPPSNSTTAGSGLATTSTTSPKKATKTLDKEIEQVGIAADRNLTSQSGWKRTLSTGKTKSLVGETLAESLNNAAKKLLETNISTNKTSRAKHGFVARSIPEYSDKGFLERTIAMAYETSGFGGPDTQIAQAFSRLDRFERGAMVHNSVFSGFTFFSRPRLCLADWNICANRKLCSLKTTDKLSIPFAIRCYLDTQYAEDSENSTNCPLFDKKNPFLVPFSNCLKNISGFNDPTLSTETSEGGFFSEDQTVVIGGDRMSRTYDINVQLKDLPGSPILAMVDYWTEYMSGLTDGSLQQYSDAIDLNRIDYTVSIYRFLTDRTRRYITRWCKCTGCYPVSTPSGVSFNKSEGEQLVTSAAELNVPFKANRIEYDDPVILKEFNILVRRYAGSDIFSGTINAFDQLPQNNYSGVPYIRPTNAGYELVWLKRSSVLGESTVADATDMSSGIRKAKAGNTTATLSDTTGKSGKAVL